MNLEKTIQEFTPISLEGLDSVKLLNRTDTKYFFPKSLLNTVLQQMRDHYDILEIDNNRKNKYRTIYYDTPDHLLYSLHHNGKANRNKVRMRKYLDSALTFLEVKFKNSKGRTIKSRKPINELTEELSKEDIEFIRPHLPIADELQPTLTNTFTRLTFVNRNNTERLTIDLDLAFEAGDKNVPLSQLVIAEVKQGRKSRNSAFIQLMKRHSQRPARISKYCVGVALLKDSVKYNTFKEKLLKIKKIENGLDVATD